MTRQCTKSTHQILRAVTALAEVADHKSAVAMEDLIEALDAFDGDSDYEPSLGSPNIIATTRTGFFRGDPLYIATSSLMGADQRYWAVGGDCDIEHDPADLGEPEADHA